MTNPSIHGKSTVKSIKEKILKSYIWPKEDIRRKEEGDVVCRHYKNKEN